MISGYMNSQIMNNTLNKPIIIGWSKDNQFSYQVNKADIHSDQLNMWIQEIDVHVVKGDTVSIPYGFVNPVMVSTTMQQMMQQQDGTISLSSGEMVLEYNLPIVKGVTYNSLKIENSGQSGLPVTVELWDNVKQEWEAIDQQAAVIEKVAPLQQLVMDGQTIRMRIKTSQNIQYRNPYIAVEGKVSQP
jgi:hypothetical protein